MAMVHTLTSAGARVVTGTAAATATVAPSPPATASALQTPAATNSVHMQQQQQQTLPVLASSCYATASSTASTSTSVAVTTSQHPCHNTPAVAITQPSDGVNGGHVTGDEVMAVAPPETASGATGGDHHQQQQQQEEEDDQPVIDIVINNVVAAFSVRCHLDLKYIAMNGDNVEYRRENGMVTMKMRNPYTTASLWSSGKVTCTGATSEDDARVGARRVARYLQRRLHFRTQFANYRVVNVLGTCNMPFAIRIADFSQKYPRLACYEPELHPGVTFRVADIRATLKIFSTGSMTVTAPSVNNVRLAIEHIFPLVHEFRKEKAAVDPVGACGRLAASRRGGPASVRHRHLLDPDDQHPDEPDDEELDVDENDCDVDEDDGGGRGGGGAGGVVQYSNGARQNWPCVPLNGTGSRAAAVSSTSTPPHKRARMALI